jgi:hypothetical protein
LAGAVSNVFNKPFSSGKKNSQSNKTSLCLRVNRSTTAANEISETLSTSTNQSAVEPVLNIQANSGFLSDRVGDL